MRSMLLVFLVLQTACGPAHRHRPSQGLAPHWILRGEHERVSLACLLRMDRDEVLRVTLTATNASDLPAYVWEAGAPLAVTAEDRTFRIEVGPWPYDFRPNILVEHGMDRLNPGESRTWGPTAFQFHGEGSDIRLGLVALPEGAPTSLSCRVSMGVEPEEPTWLETRRLEFQRLPVQP